MPRSKSSTRWLRTHFSDEFVKRAQKDGYRGRAVYKLKEIDERDRLFRPGMTVVDIGAAPGSWSQYAAARVGPRGRVFALDILPVEPMAGTEVIQGDVTDPAVLDLLMSRLDGRRADLVISDLAPNMSGIAAADQAHALRLVGSALDFAARILIPGGTALIKAFHGAGYDSLYKETRLRFVKLTSRKPKASRSDSSEVYLLGRGFNGSKPV